jgi:hypothetical protein
MDIQKVLENHKKWQDDNGGERADLSDADLRGADLSDADLRGANLSDANLSDADLRGANLSDANLSDAGLRGADLSDANLSDANLSYASLRGADLRGANLSDASLRGANLSDANLSGASGLLNPAKWIAENFKKNENGSIVCYKTFGSMYKSPEHWTFEPGEYVTEEVNGCRSNDCGCGVNVASLDWVRREFSGEIWECEIEPDDFLSVVVPYNTNGKFRAGRVKIVRKVERGEK